VSNLQIAAWLWAITLIGAFLSGLGLEASFHHKRGFALLLFIPGILISVVALILLTTHNWG